MLKEMEKEAITNLSNEGVNEQTQLNYFKHLVVELDRIQKLSERKRHDRINEIKESLRHQRDRKSVMSCRDTRHSQLDMFSRLSPQQDVSKSPPKINLQRFKSSLDQDPSAIRSRNQTVDLTKH